MRSSVDAHTSPLHSSPKGLVHVTPMLPGQLWLDFERSEVAIGPAGRLKKGLSLEIILRDSEIAMENIKILRTVYVMKYAPLPCGHSGFESI